MYLAYRWVSRNLGRTEVIFFVIIVSIVLGTGLNKTLELFAVAEKHLVEATVSNIKTALRLQTAIQSLGIPGEVKITEGMNPVILMQSMPDDYEFDISSPVANVELKQFSVKPLTNYLGEFFDPDINSLERANWYFDYNGNLLIYLIKNRDYIGDNANEPTELKYRVQLDYTDVNNNEHYEAGVDKLNSASLVRVEG